MSGSPGLNFNTMSDLVANNTAAIAQAAGCLEDRDSQSTEIVDCLRKAPAELLANLSVTTSRAARPPFGEGFFYPTYDNDMITDRPFQLMQKGMFSKGIPIIASWVANEGAWYAAPTTSTDDEVLASFGLWLTGLTELTKRKLLELYPVDDFAAMVRPDYDGPMPVSPQYYRAAQINRDFWFTCPALDFTWQYIRNGGVGASSKVRLYEHNATRYAPAFAMMGVPMWRVAHLSDIPYVLNAQRLGGGADNSAAQLGLSKTMSRTLARFVARGTPVDESEEADDGTAGASWPPAYASAAADAPRGESPDQLTLKLFGGPHHNSPVTVRKTGRGSNAAATDGQKAVEWEKLFHRCEFINSEQVRAETGV